MSYQTSYDPVSMRWSLSDGSHYLELPEWAREVLIWVHERETKPLKNENAKLRELISNVHEALRADKAGLFHGLTLASMEDDMRELGIEVDDA